MTEKHPYYRRKSPEELLEEWNSMQRGKLKLYIGSSPGVGKSYRMLQDANELKKDGKDVVIGLIETHKRKDTERQIRELESIPLLEIVYNGKSFYEVNTAKIIEKRPEIVIIDELAHTNIQGSKHEKRYMDVEEILEAGIDVYSAVNIQHIESVHDIVENITGIKVNERVPDPFIDRAFEIQLIDITPSELRKRMVEGKIYASNKIKQSLDHFFREDNLSALRELALREVANDVDEKIEDRDRHLYQGPVGIYEKILVCVQHSSTGEKLIRRGWRMANRLKAQLYVLHVIDTDATTITSPQKETIQCWQELCEHLEATFLVEKRGRRKPAQIIVEVAKDKFITQIFLGQSARTRWEEIRKGSIVNEIMRNTSNMEIHIVADPRVSKKGFR